MTDVVDSSGNGQGVVFVRRNEVDSVRPFSVHPEQHGSSGDGTTDDANAINNAFSALAAYGGGRIVLTAGKTYLVNRDLTLSADNVIIEARGGKIKPAEGVTITFTKLIDGPSARQWLDITDSGVFVFATGQAGFPEWFGIDGVNDHTEITAACLALTEINFVRGKLYVGADQAVVTLKPALGRILNYNKAVFRDIVFTDYQYPGNSNPSHGMRSGGLTHRGAVLQRNVASTVSPSGPMNITSADVIVEGVVVEEFNGQQGYNDGITLYHTSLRCKIKDCASRAMTSLDSAPDGLIVRGRGHVIENFSYEGHDDCITIKAPTDFGDFASGAASTRDIQINGVYSEGGANVFSVGSEIGFGVENVYAENLCGRDTGSIVSYEIGRLADYAGGFLRDTFAMGGVLRSDRLFVAAIDFHARGGNYGENIHASGFKCSVRGRDNTAAIYGVRVRADREAQEGTMHDPTYIENWSIDDIAVYDRLDGAPYNGTSIMTYALDHLLFVQEVNSATISNGRITRFHGRGCENAGIYIDCPSGNQLLLHDVTIEKWGSSVSAAALEVTANSSVKIEKFKAIPGSSGAGYSQRIFSFAAGAVVEGEKERARVGDIAAGNIGTFYWQAPSNCFILKVELINQYAVTQDVTGGHYSTYELRNMPGGAALYSGTPDLVAGTALQLGSGYFSDTVGAAAYIAKGDYLRFYKSDTGSGRALSGAVLVIHYIKY